GGSRGTLRKPRSTGRTCKLHTERTQPWNMMIKHRQIQRRGRRSHMSVSYTDPQVSMDLLRAVLQPSFNDDIMAVFKKYHKVRKHTQTTHYTHYTSDATNRRH
uniref:Deoxynucleotidyltransferase terminal-interacting protein 1 n=1 Tax=Gouania willdenowi TaxID=441366 RepID=A0A8C5ELE5_GOUWI